MIEPLLVASIFSLGLSPPFIKVSERKSFEDCLIKPIGTIVTNYPTVELLNMRFCEVAADTASLEESYQRKSAGEDTDG